MLYWGHFHKAEELTVLLHDGGMLSFFFFLLLKHPSSMEISHEYNGHQWLCSSRFPSVIFLRENKTQVEEATLFY